jgi:hypothetical protein
MDTGTSVLQQRGSGFYGTPAGSEVLWLLPAGPFVEALLTWAWLFCSRWEDAAYVLNSRKCVDLLGSLGR